MDNSRVTVHRISLFFICGRYDGPLERIIYKSFTSHSPDTSQNNAFVGNETLFIGGKPSDDFGNQLSGSMMEFRYWTT